MEPDVTITIAGTKNTPEWEALQKLVHQTTGKPGKFTRIARKDGGIDYRGHGEYEITYITDTGEKLHITMTCN